MCVFGANPNKCNERTGQTALHHAVARNHVNVVKYVMPQCLFQAIH